MSEVKGSRFVRATCTRIDDGGAKLIGLDTFSRDRSAGRMVSPFQHFHAREPRFISLSIVGVSHPPALSHCVSTSANPKPETQTADSIDQAWQRPISQSQRAHKG